MTPVGNQRAFDPGSMAGVVGDERRGADGGPTVEAAVHDFDTGQYTGEGIGNLIAIEGAWGGGQIAREAEGEFGFDDAHEEIAGGEARGAIEGGGREQTAVERLWHAEEALRDGVGAGYLVADDVAAVVGGEPLDEARLALIRLRGRGVASGEGIVVVATANGPAALDPAILRRPGRFDRVVNFPNPSRNMRLRYFLHMNPNVAPAAIEQTIADSSGLSFAQLREAAVLASQFAFERNDDVTAIDLLRGVHTLRETIVQSSAHSNSAGFTSVTQDGLAV